MIFAISPFSLLGKHVCLRYTESRVCRNQVECIYFFVHAFSALLCNAIFMTEQHQSTCHETNKEKNARLPSLKKPKTAFWMDGYLPEISFVLIVASLHRVFTCLLRVSWFKLTTRCDVFCCAEPRPVNCG